MSNRKDFLKQSALLTASIFILPACTSKSNNQVGLQLYTLRDIIAQDVSAVIKKVADVGYNHVETYGYSTADGFWGLSPKSFKSLLDQNNLRSTSGHYDLEEYIRTGKENQLHATIEAANILGQEYVTLPYLQEDLRGSADKYLMIADKMNKMAEHCKEAGLKFAYHNHDFEFEDLGNGHTGYKIFMENTDVDLVQFELDIYWVHHIGMDPVALFNQYPNRFPMWHVKDMDKKNRDLNTEIGTGSIDFKPVFKEAEISGMKYFFVEQENFIQGKDPYQSIKESRNFIKNVLI